MNANEAIVQAVAEGTRVAIQAVAAARVERRQNEGPKLGGPIMKQPTFNLSFTFKYAELRNFKFTEKNMFQNYSISQAERVPIFKKLGRQGQQLLESLSKAEQEVCDTEEGLFETLNNKFKL